MAININVQVARSVPRLNDEGLTLVVFRHAREIQGESLGYSSEPIRVDSLQDLYDNFNYDSGSEHSFSGQKELYEAEYLIRAGVNLLCFSVQSEGSIAESDISKFSDVGGFNYKLVVVPGLFVYGGIADSSVNNIMDFAKDNDVQLFLNFSPELFTAAGVGAAISTYTSYRSAKTELAFNFGLPDFLSSYSDIPTDFDADGVGFYGISAASAIVARKAYLLNTGTPWEPVAGETNGKTNEFSKLLWRISNTEKEAMQALNVNVLVTKVGVGSRFVSQNTMYVTTNPKNPLLRSHAVTTTLWLKREFSKVSDRFMHNKNILKTWNMFSLALSSILEEAKRQDGVEQYSVGVGLGKTMTEEDISNGLLIAGVSVLIVRVIEGVTINITLQESTGSYNIIIDGGVL